MYGKNKLHGIHNWLVVLTQHHYTINTHPIMMITVIILLTCLLVAPEWFLLQRSNLIVHSSYHEQTFSLERHIFVPVYVILACSTSSVLRRPNQFLHFLLIIDFVSECKGFLRGARVNTSRAIVVAYYVVGTHSFWMNCNARPMQVSAEPLPSR